MSYGWDYIFSTYNKERELTEDEKDVVKNNIVRESPEDKVKDLLEWMDSIKKNIRHKVSRNSV